ncbi:diguanylate cyclase [Methylohalobius crimeensis]|uniref:diguanylate cyclase n=1 Tax=Methylohalobius crimeensis TaxID=244365 RepID=UPI000415CF8B|nr:diguanylate cyclase [Methylohalobius crimeensis]
MPDQDKWKHKCLLLAQELDQQQDRWDRAEKRLVRVLVRLSLACERDRTHLVPHLQRLRDVLRGGVLDPHRLEELDALSDTLFRLGEQSEAGVTESQQAFLFDLLSECAPSAAVKARLDRLREMSFPDTRILLHSLQNVFGDEQASGTPSGWGTLRRWFGRKEAVLEGKADGNKLREHLLQLLEEIEVPPPLTEAGERLTESLRQGCPIEAGLDETARLLAEINARVLEERAEIEDFLGQLTDKLQVLEAQAQEFDRIFQNGSDAWNESLSVQVDHLRRQTLKETSLEALKAVITERLDTLATHIQTFREAEARKNEQMARQITALTERLTEMEQESQGLHQRLQVAHQQALYDSVTGLANRKAVDERLSQEFSRWKRFGQSFCLLLWDIDHFKRINDRFGHRAGDKTLRIVGQTLREGIRSVDFVGRYGGEEFLMLLPGTELDGGMQVADKLRRLIKECGFNSRGKPVPITISCGLTGVCADDTPASLFERADNALYRAKQAGRDRCLKL